MHNHPINNSGKFFIIAGLIMAAAQCLYAANHYVRQGATGSGSDWSNAYGSLPAALARGDTYYVADGAYNGYTFDDAVSGTKVITVKKATVADHGIETGWQSGYGDGNAQWNGEIAFRTSYYVFDGQTGGGPDQWRSGFGFKVPYTGGWACLTVGDPGGDSASRESDRSNITISHVEAWGPVLGGAPCSNTGGEGIGLAGGATGHSNITLSYLWLHDLAIQIQGGFVKNVLLEYSCLERNASSATCHSEAWAAWGPSYRVTVRYNIFSDIEGTGVLVTTKAKYWQVYGNVFTCTPGNPYGCGVGNGVIGTTDHAGEQSDSCEVYNNTFANLVGGSSSGIDFSAAEGTADGNKAYNNLWFNCQAGIGFTGVEHNYSWFYGNPNNAGLVSAEPNAQAGTGDPFVDASSGNYCLKAATNAGTTLAAAFAVDANGTTRGADGTWDRGAYEYATAGALQPRPEQENNHNPVYGYPGPLSRFLADNRAVYDLAGKKMHSGATPENGVYLIRTAPHGSFQKILLVK